MAYFGTPFASPFFGAPAYTAYPGFGGFSPFSSPWGAAFGPKIKLTYFDIPGLAEPVRLAFHIGGIPFEDERLTREEFAERKESLPSKQVPVLEVDGKTLTQSGAILRYAGSQAGLIPSDPWTAAKMEEIQGMFTDMLEKFRPTFALEGDAQVEARKKFAEEGAPVHFGAIEKAIQANGQGWAAGSTMTVVDLQIFGFCVTFGSGMFDGVPKDMLEKYPGIQAIKKAVEQHPKVAAYLAYREQVKKEKEAKEAAEKKAEEEKKE
eukprot:NODE_1167_length_973_cov_115.288416_g1122_i0.p1 GENE.NODE_1167_length_973_cov_115.288416_g1122_i0~~NODE_1167_length_973_cov_115.288416_g1122_i0.p1  ORF type:complete len:264 (+),score=98.26 NODE_1167_length_973_cov_115.288416_g1122_i0:84-875(+)